MKGLRRRFIIAAMASMFAVLAAIVIGMNIIGYTDVVRSADNAIKMITDGGGVFPENNSPSGLTAEPVNGAAVNGMSSGTADDKDKDASGQEMETPPPKPDDEGVTPPDLPNGQGGGTQPEPPNGQGDATELEPPSGDGNDPSANRANEMSEEAPYETRYFSVYLDDDGDVVSVRLDNIAAVSESDATEFVKEILESGSEKGFVSGRYRYLVTNYDGESSKSSKMTIADENANVRDVSSSENDDEVDLSSAVKMIVFVDCQNRLDTFLGSVRTSALVSLAGLLVVFLLVLGTSKLVFRPVEISEMRQKQFLTDASHELKTPLAIIEANTEVMELEAGETKWTQSTKKQVKRLSDLVSQMVALTRLDEGDLGGKPAELDYSRIVRESVESYIAPAQVENKELTIDIEGGVKAHGNEKNIRQMIGLLMDNAVKYSLPTTEIKVSLRTHGRKSELVIYNKATGLEKGDNSVLFERFYRADSSRNSKTGGSGIGLSVVYSIVEREKGKITAISEDGESLTMTVTLPL